MLALPTAAQRAPPRSTRSVMSRGPMSVVVGIRTTPSLIPASMSSHSSTWLPSMMIMRSPRRTPLASEPVGKLRGPCGELGEAAAGGAAVLLDDHQRRVVGRAGVGRDLVEPVEGEVELAETGPLEVAVRPGVVGAQLKEPIAGCTEVVGDCHCLPFALRGWVSADRERAGRVIRLTCNILGHPRVWKRQCCGAASLVTQGTLLRDDDGGAPATARQTAVVRCKKSLSVTAAPGFRRLLLPPCVENRDRNSALVPGAQVLLLDGLRHLVGDFAGLRGSRRSGRT